MRLVLALHLRPLPTILANPSFSAIPVMSLLIYDQNSLEAVRYSRPLSWAIIQS